MNDEQLIEELKLLVDRLSTHLFAIEKAVVSHAPLTPVTGYVQQKLAEGVAAAEEAQEEVEKWFTARALP